MSATFEIEATSFVFSANQKSVKMSKPQALIDNDYEMDLDADSVNVRNYTDFARFRYELKGSGAHLAKDSSGKDAFSYTGFTVPAGTTFFEVQINQFSSTRHAYLPNIVERAAGISFAGPILIACVPDEKSPYSVLLAYEHGGEYTDDFIKFYITQNEKGNYEISLEAGDGTYCNNQYFDEHKPYITPFFEIGIVTGNLSDMLHAYRHFLLNEMSNAQSSRTPYIFYNTWNNQERNRAHRGRKYLEDMNTAQMLKEIEIAHRIGIDVFVIDTGWYKKTGDWTLDIERFPDGLRDIRALLSRYNMKLGLWFNPAAAAVTSGVVTAHPEWIKQYEGKEVNIGPVWETEESFEMCLASDYADWFTEKLIEVGLKFDVKYFKWDAVNLFHCTASHHNHGGEDSTPEQREKNFSHQCGQALTKIAGEVSKRIPGAIVDLDVTEGARYVGLDFLSAGKFFHMNNGPYYHDFDIPNARETYKENWNVFFYPGRARNEVCRQAAVHYDQIIPSILFLTHFFPDGPASVRKQALCSLALGGNGFWGDLHSLTADDIAEIHDFISRYKEVANDATAAYPHHFGFIGASPEVHEKINQTTGRGFVAFFTRKATTIEYITQNHISSSKKPHVNGAGEYKVLPNDRLYIKVSLHDDDARCVFIT